PSKHSLHLFCKHRTLNARLPHSRPRPQNGAAAFLCTLPKNPIDIVLSSCYYSIDKKRKEGTPWRRRLSRSSWNRSAARLASSALMWKRKTKGSSRFVRATAFTFFGSLKRR